MQYDVTIIGAGIVGLASALKLLEKKPELKLALIEKESAIAKHQTGNNSGVIHSGVYYKPGSLKAQNCINGYHQLLAFCDENKVQYDLCGKVIVATDESELQALENIWIRGNQNGLENLKKLNQEELKNHEPHVKGIAGIFVPQTGIINYTNVSKKYAELIEQKGGKIFLNERVSGIKNLTEGLEIQTDKNTHTSKRMINCAGLYCDKIARMTQKNIDVKIVPFRGEYYEIKPEKQHLVKNLIYPVPDPNFPFLGVHFTRMIEGGVEAGPNAVLAYQREGYKKSQINLGELGETLAWPGFQKVALKYWKTGIGELYRSYSKTAFTKALQKLIPEIQKSDLKPGGAGVRAQACDKKGGLLDDFKIIENAKEIHVLNAPSPAATSSLSIGNSVAEMLLKKI